MEQRLQMQKLCWIGLDILASHPRFSGPDCAVENEQKYWTQVTHRLRNLDLFCPLFRLLGRREPVEHESITAWVSGCLSTGGPVRGSKVGQDCLYIPAWLMV